MILLFLSLLLFQSSIASEFYCIKKDTVPTSQQVEGFMNSKEEKDKYKLKDPTVLDNCKQEDIVIVRRIKVDIESKKATRFLDYLKGPDMEKFAEKGGLCNTEYTVDAKEIEYSGRGDISVNEALHGCGYRQRKCGDEVFVYSAQYHDVWCKYSLKDKKWTAYFMDSTEETRVFRVYDDEIVCEIGDKKSGHSVICQKEDCSNIEGMNEQCNEKKMMKKRMYSYTQIASQWADEAFKHYVRNYILTFIGFCYFMLQVRRTKMIRKQLSASWKKFKGTIENSQEEENTLLEATKKRDNYMEERFEGEKKAKDRVPFDHLKQEMEEAKDFISEQAQLIEMRKGEESASCRPPNVVGMKVIRKEPISTAKLRNIIQWQWIIESSMHRTAIGNDNGTELCKFYGLDGNDALSNMS